MRLSLSIYSCAVLAFCCLSLNSCERSGLGALDSGASRTLLAYIAADNNLSDEAEARCEALCRGRAGWSGGELLIFVDSPSGACLMRALEDGSRDTVEVYGSVDSASAEFFGSVLGQSVASWPSSEGYGLIFFSHASGWLPSGALSATNLSFGRDDSAGDESAEMELEDFAAVIPDGLLDFIIFETCLSSGAEVAYALKDKARYMLASAAEILSPGFTPVYPEVLAALLNASLSAPAALQNLAEAYMEHVATYANEVYRSATLAITDLSRMEALATCFAAVNPKELYPETELENVQHFDRPGYYGESPAVARYFDLEGVAELTASSEVLAALQEELSRTVLWKSATERFMARGSDYSSYGGFDILTHCGLTVYLPREGLTGLNEAYRRTQWYTAVYT